MAAGMEMYPNKEGPELAATAQLSGNDYPGKGLGDTGASASAGSEGAVARLLEAVARAEPSVRIT
eukprot:14108377-Alexandrium_andersonii.AAC.1